jgi:hypothetical protein
MRRIVLLLFTLGFSPNVTQSQSIRASNNWELGASASFFVNDVNIRLIVPPNTTLVTLGGVENRASFAGGIFLKLNHTHRISSLIELQYASMNMQFRRKRQDGMGDSILVGIDSYRYAQLNPMIGYRVFKGFSLYAGPSLNILVGSVGKSRQLITGRWMTTRAFLNKPWRGHESDVKPIVLGWQAKMVYQYKRLSAHATYFKMEQRMGRWYDKRPNPVYNDFYFSSWQFGLAYSILK